MLLSINDKFKLFSINPTSSLQPLWTNLQWKSDRLFKLC